MVGGLLEDINLNSIWSFMKARLAKKRLNSWISETLEFVAVGDERPFTTN